MNLLNQWSFINSVMRQSSNSEARKIKILKFPVTQRANWQTPSLFSVTGEAARLANQRQQLEEELRQRIEQERLVSRIAQRIRHSLDLETILNTTVLEIQQVLHSDRVMITRLQDDWQGEIVAEAIEPGWASLLGLSFYDSCLAENYAHSGQSRWVRAIRDVNKTPLPQCHAKLLTQLQVKASVVLPLVVGERLWGALMVHECYSSRQWQPHEIELLQQLTTHLALMIQRSEQHKVEMKMVACKG